MEAHDINSNGITGEAVAPPADSIGVEALLGVFRQLLREEVEDAVRRAMRPVLASPAWFMQKYDISESTFYREIERCRIFKRDCHGAHWQKGAGPVRYSVAEWERKQVIHTRSIQNDLRRQKHCLE